MEQLFKAIYAKFTASSGGHTSIYNDVSGQFYLVEAPQSTSINKPYVVYYPISQEPIYTFNETAENATIQFNLFSETSAATEITNMFKHLTSLYDWCSLSVSGYNHIFMKRQFAHLTRTSSCWNYAVQYEVEIQK